VMVSQEGLQ